MSNNLMVWSCGSVGLLDNILFDFLGGRLPLDDININWFFLTSAEEKRLRKFYNLAVRDGVNSVNHLKLCFIAFELIRKYNNNFLGFTSYRVFEKRYIKGCFNFSSNGSYAEVMEKIRASNICGSCGGSDCCGSCGGSYTCGKNFEAVEV